MYCGFYRTVLFLLLFQDLIEYKEEKAIFLIFHVAFPLLLFEIPLVKKHQMNRFALAIGSLLPDIIDKPIYLLGLGNGRFVSHNLLFITLAFLAVLLISRRNFKLSIPFLIGMGLHLVLDLPYVPWFYPFMTYESVIIEEPILSWFIALFTDPLAITTELLGVSFCIIILINNKLYHLKHIIYYLKGNLEVPKEEIMEN
ncbi:MAG: metal-dependent hydrolase [Promethearchaeota archaeon]